MATNNPVGSAAKRHGGSIQSTHVPGRHPWPLTCLLPRVYLPTAFPLNLHRRGVWITAGTALPAASPRRCPLFVPIRQAICPLALSDSRLRKPTPAIISVLDISIGLQWLVHEAPLVFVKGALHPPGVVGRGFRHGAGPSTRRPAPLPQSRSRARSLSLSLLFSRPRVVAVIPLPLPSSSRCSWRAVVALRLSSARGPGLAARTGTRALLPPASIFARAAPPSW